MQSDLARRESGYWADVVASRPDTFMATLAAQSAGAAASRTHVVRYGPDAAQAVDVWLPAGTSPSPVLIAFHGGYWQFGERQALAFAAGYWTARGIAFASAGYRLAPAVPFPAICRDAQAAVAAIAGCDAVDPSRMLLAGHSAGAFLAADASSDVPIAGAALLSGVFDLRPLAGTTPGLAIDVLGWLERHAAAPTMIAWGADETRAFKAQSLRLVALRARARLPVEAAALPGCDHYRILGELACDGPVARFLVACIA